MGETPGVTSEAADGGVAGEVRGYTLAVPVRFRGLTQRQGLLWRGPGGVGGVEPVPRLRRGRAGALAAGRGRGGRPGLAGAGPHAGARQLHGSRGRARAGGTRSSTASGCRTAKVKVAERGQTLADDLARCEAVRDALGPDGRLRVDANGGWDLATAERSVRALDRFDLEYVEQPCASVEDLAALRVRLARAGRPVPVAADESIRRAEDPYRVVALDAADVAVLKVAPLGGVRAALEVAERIGLPVVVSSALETSVGLAAGVALAAALPELPYACGLATLGLLADDVVTEPLRPVAGDAARPGGHGRRGPAGRAPDGARRRGLLAGPARRHPCARTPAAAGARRG